MKKIFLVPALLCLIACSKKQENVPSGLLSPAKFTSIMADIHIAESQVEVMHIGADTAKVVFENLKKDLLKKQGVTSQLFDKTYDYYVNHNLKALDKIYEGLVDTLEVRDAKFASKHGQVQAPPVKVDSSDLQ